MAWKFNEVDQSVQITDNAALSLPDSNWSMGGWINFDNVTGSLYQYFISCGAFNSANTFHWYLYETSTSPSKEIRFIMNGTTISIFSTSTPGDTTGWQHVLLVRSGSTLTQYIDGVADGSVAISGGTNCESDLYFGRRAITPADRWYDGSTAEWAKWDRALNSGEISDLSGGDAPSNFPTSLAWYIDMIDDYTESEVPLTVTNNSSTIVTHPSINYPSSFSTAWAIHANTIIG